MKIKKKRYYNNKIAIDIFYDKNLALKNIREGAVIVNGFPDFPGINPMTEFLASLGYLVFQPHMSGSFDSDYEFDPCGFEKTFKALNDFIYNSRGSDNPNDRCIKMDWNIESLVVVGHSFGAFIILRNIHYLNNVNNVIFTSAVLHYKKNSGCLENGVEQYEMVKRKYPFTYRLGKVSHWKGMWDGDDILPIKPFSTVTSVILIHGENDPYFSIPLVKENAKEIIASYIRFNEYRLVIIENSGHPLIELFDNQICKDSIMRTLGK